MYNADGGAPQRWRPRRPLEEEEYTPKQKLVGQRPVDLFCSAIHRIQNRHYHKNSPFVYHVAPHPYNAKELLPPRSTSFNPSTGLCTQWVNTSFHPSSRQQHRRVAFTGLHWSPNGRRLLCTTRDGEFLVYNSHSFGLEVKTVAHEGQV